MKNIAVLFIIAMLLTASSSEAKTFYCANCSTRLIQSLDRITNRSQLAYIIKEYQEAVQQTQQQIRMVQQNIEQYANMVQNTARLPANLVNEVKGNMTRLAALTSQLKTQRGDITGLGEIFNTLFPEQSIFGDLAASSTPKDVATSNARYTAEWDKWAKNVDQAAQATFQLSGAQLAEFQKDPERLQQYINNLLSSPDGQMQAIQAGNQLAALQMQEIRQLRELMATQSQSLVASQMKGEKEAQMKEALWRDMMKTDKLKNAESGANDFEKHHGR